MQRFLLLALSLVVAALAVDAALPSNFLYGTATASYQIEGAWNVDGKQPGEWDLFSHIPGKIQGNDTGDVADDGYARALEDVQLLRQLGVNSYRFSISWGRIIDANGNVNAAGVAHYSKLVDALLGVGITPLVTMYHWDMPLQYGTMQGDSGKGWLNSAYIVPLFETYADALFDALGDRVRHWIIFNEPHTFCVGGFATGALAPGRCSDRAVCDEGNSSTEPYQCAHSVILAYSAVAKLYHSKYAPLHTHSGPAKLGFSLDCGHAEPYSSSAEDVAAAENQMLFTLGWWADPLFSDHHDYPPVMRKNVGDRLPKFTEQQKKDLADYVPSFFGFNHYTSFYAFAQDNSTDPFSADQRSGTSHLNSAGQSIGPVAASSWLYVVPWGFAKALQWIQARYPQVDSIIVTENGVDAPGEATAPLPDVLHDEYRVNYLQQYLSNMTEIAVTQHGVPVTGYFVWSFLDNFEWGNGYSCRFGLYYVDYANNCTRHAKDSVAWYGNWIKEQKALTAEAEEKKHNKSKSKHSHAHGKKQANKKAKQEKITHKKAAPKHAAARKSTHSNKQH